jgi:hypothetical protein
MSLAKWHKALALLFRANPASHRPMMLFYLGSKLEISDEKERLRKHMDSKTGLCKCFVENIKLSL